ncbi:MAG: DUF6318 family protein, partial [Nocardioidaceae bacterium]
VIGCSDDAEPKAKPRATPSASKSASPSPTPTAKPPTVPASASQRTDRAAIDFARYFIDVLNYTSISGDTTELTAIVSADCESCQNIVKSTDEVYAAGGYLRGGAWTVKSQSVFRPDKRPARIVSFEIRAAKQEYKAATDVAVEHIKGGDEVVNVHVSPSRKSWIVTQMQVAS